MLLRPRFSRRGVCRRYFIDSLCLDAHKVLRQNGHLVFIQSSAAGLTRTLAMLEANGFDWEVVAAAQFPWRDYYNLDPSYLTMAE